MSHLFNSVDPAFASRLDGVWGTWSVVWSATGAAPSLGNGTLTAAWQRISDIAFYSLSLVFGTTTSAGTGDWKFTTPAPVYAPFGLTPNGAGQAWALHVSVTELQARVAYGSTFLQLYADVSTAPFGQTVPFTWGNGDTLRIGGWFPIDFS